MFSVWVFSKCVEERCDNNVDERDVGVAASYRPICLIPVLGKIMEKLIVLRLTSVFYSSISGRQFGFIW